MNELVKIETVNGMNVVSSRDVAEGLGKEHSKVIRSIEQLLAEPNVASLILASNYTDLQGKPRKEYLLTKDGFILYMFNIQGYQEFKLAYIAKFNEMEKALKNKFQVPTNFKEALLLAVKQQEKIEELQEEVEIRGQLIGELKPAKDYLDTILASGDTMKITQIASDYGLSAVALNKILNEQRIIRKVNKQWILYNTYTNKGYTKSHTFTVKENKTIIETVWTQKGRLFIHETLTKLGYKANMDKELEVNNTANNKVI